MSRVVLALVDDLIFASRIQAESQQAQATFHRVGSAAALRESVRNERPALIVIDLEGMGFDGVAALHELREEPHADGVPRLAFGSHVAADTLEAAQAAGATALARSQFVKQLGDWIRRSVD